MKTPLKVGDRVAVYGDSENWANAPGGRWLAVIDEIKSETLVGVSREGSLRRYFVHPKQCRRLKPKRKLREFWIPKSMNKFELELLKAHGIDCLARRPIPEISESYIHVREVPARKGEK